mmetsp:Transcript_9696/g.29473  ORF Transcript_9696/g.29473 Transcript_9696/m.29473 type:complete len:336 (-) Transcript_9696:935-1942(-)|eukprot:CAMPEP_0198723374 /NCGR_PEP_ID=MMETSP1475-20131203/890_1 /TAXON_ID= ORGANISM="Unidentified sp., Strain CCMP1999" /NCGR_SAMPLE_ID=MMETSP1475 /ASSEMBLY_ACC=CAM_ASM_001111 /LENGTH=335 /DNA_ID=CAMNT_0044484479 /DNA_START=131 /DNA_END=1138 /DNA_ORIENTATION=-
MAPAEAEIDSEVKRWLDAPSDDADALLAEVNKALALRVFLAGEKLSVADVSVYEKLHKKMSDPGWTDEKRVSLANAWRWFDLVQHLSESNRDLPVVEFNRDVGPEAIAKGEKLVQSASAKGKGQPDGTDADAARAAKAAAKKAAKDAKKAAKKEAKKEAPPAEPQAKKEETLSVTRLDIRVGNIVKAENHPDADSLYVEQIDVGETEPRTVCSGLRKYFPTSDTLLGPCVVLCNLKPVKMRGIVSQAMVLCATSTDGDTVELVQPPEGVSAGMRVTFEGESGEPDAQLNPKKQIFEKIAPDLKTNDECVAIWRGVPFMTEQGPCKVKSVKGGGIK